MYANGLESHCLVRNSCDSSSAGLLRCPAGPTQEMGSLAEEARRRCEGWQDASVHASRFRGPLPDLDVLFEQEEPVEEDSAEDQDEQDEDGGEEEEGPELDAAAASLRKQKKQRKQDRSAQCSVRNCPLLRDRQPQERGPRGLQVHFGERLRV